MTGEDSDLVLFQSKFIAALVWSCLLYVLSHVSQAKVDVCKSRADMLEVSHCTVLPTSLTDTSNNARLLTETTTRRSRLCTRRQVAGLLLWSM
jgi:hypothetical protein